MQTISNATRTAMNKTVTQVVPEAIFEFDHSLMHNSTVNSPDSRNEELFPKTSVTRQRYTASGLPRALVGQTIARDHSADIQYRIVDAEDTYKYWVSPTLSTAGGINNAWMEVIYDRDRPTNRIVAVFETSYARPTSVTVQTLTGSTWTTRATNVQPDSRGVVNLYRQSNGSWTNTENVGPPANIKGVRVTVNSMSQSGVSAHFIAISARYRVDMSERITDFSIDKNLENVTPLSPIGDTSVNSLSISLENEDKQLDPENSSSPFYNLLSRNVRVYTSVKVENNPSIPQGSYFAESWSYSAPSVELGVSCSDYSRFMQEIFLPPFTLRSYRVKDAVREILQRAGFNIDGWDVETNPVIPYIWYNEEVSVWQALKDLANATMAYFFVKENGQFMWIDFAKMKSYSSQLTLDADENLISLDHNFDVIANKINVEYNIYGAPTDPVTGDRITQELWTPSEDQALLSMPLGANMTSTSTSLAISTDEDGFKFWPEKGYVYVQGERIEYTGKDESTRRLTGLKRGAFGTTPRAHTRSNLGTINTIGTRRGSLSLTSAGNLRIQAPSNAISRDYNMSLSGSLSSAHRVYGTRMRFPARATYEIAGLVINRRGTYGGIFIEISTTHHAVKNNRNEIRVFRKTPNGNTDQWITNSKGRPYEVAIKNWYDIEVTVEYTQANNAAYSVYVNGKHIISFLDAKSRASGRFGPFVRGASGCSFARMYVSDGAGTGIGIKNFQDVLSGSSFSSDYVFETDDPTLSVNEYAPRVRQIMEYDVDYAKYPALAGTIFNSNIWQARAFRHTPGPFGSHFYMENKSDGLAVIHGRSPNLFSEEMDMTLMVYGDPVVVASEENVEAKDELSIRRNGAVDLEVSNPWIQTNEMANNIADMIVSNFSDPMDTVTADVWPDYALQLGDTVSIEYADHGYKAATHQYYVLGSSLSWGNGGFSQSLTLRRRR